MLNNFIDSLPNLRTALAAFVLCFVLAQYVHAGRPHVPDRPIAIERCDPPQITHSQDCLPTFSPPNFTTASFARHTNNQIDFTLPQNSSIQAETQTLQLGAIADTFVVSGFPSTNLGNVAGLWVGYTDEDAIGIERGLVQFDISSLPSHSFIVRAGFFMAMGQTNNEALIDLKVHRMGISWRELEATWDNTAAGKAEIHDTLSIGGELGWYRWDITDLVTAWYIGDHPNFGLMISGPAAGPDNDRGFITKEVDAAFAPQLIIEFIVDRSPPMTHLSPLPQYSPVDHLMLRWNVAEAGAGIDRYEIEYRDQADSQWQTAQTVSDSATTSIQITDTIPGHSYDFRMRAIDRAGNFEPWPISAESSTTVYGHLGNGQVIDNRGVPVPYAQLRSVPPGLNTAQTDSAGNFTMYWAESGPYTLSAIKSGFGSLSTNLNVTEDKVNVELVLPPADNLISNGSFQIRNMTGWRIEGSNAEAVSVPLNLLGQEHGLHIDGLGLQPLTESAWPGTSPSLTIDSGNRVHIVWSQLSNPVALDSSDLYLVSRSPDGVWSQPKPVVPGANLQWHPRLAADREAGLHLSWIESDLETGNYIMYAFSNPDGLWSDPDFAFSVPSTDELMALAISDDNILYLAWTRHRGQVIVAYRQLPNGVWSSPLALPSSAGQVSNLQLEIWQETAHLLWQVNDHSTSALSQAFFTGGENDAWLAPVPLPGPLNGQLPSLFEMDVAPDGTIHIIQYSDNELAYIRKPRGSNFNVAQRFSGQYPSKMTIAAENDRSHLLWGQNIGLAYATIDDTGQLSQPIKLAPAGPNANPPAPGSFGPILSVDGLGNLHLLALDSSETNRRTNIRYLGPSTSDGDETMVIQTIAIPASTWWAPTLSWRYRWLQLSANPNAQFEVRIGRETVWSISGTSWPWTHAWFDLSRWQGTTEEIHFVARQVGVGNRARLELDDISLGTAYADVFTDMVGPSASLPAKTISYDVIAGNRGGGPAIDVTLSLVLSSGLVDVQINPPPAEIQGETLIWHFDILEGQSKHVITVEAGLDPQLPLFTTITHRSSISTSAPESQTSNNVSSVNTTVIKRVYLPVALKNAFP